MPGRGELAATLELRGRAQFLAGLRDVNKGVRDMTKAVKDTGTTSESTDRSLAKIYRKEHISGIGGLTGAFGGLRTQLIGTLGLLVGAGGLVAGLEKAVGLASQLSTTNTQIAVASGARAANLPGLRQMQGSFANRGFTKGQVAQGQYHIESAYGGNISNAQVRQIFDNSGRLYALGGGKQGGMDPVTTANLLTTLMRADPSLKNNSTRASALLNATHAAGNMTLANLMAALGTGAPATLAAMGISFNSLAPALAVAGDTRGGDQVAPFARLLQTPIMKAFNPTAPALGAEGKLRIGKDELQNDLRGPNGLVTMIDDLHKHLAPFSKNEQDKLVGQIFGGSRGSAPIFSLLGNLPMLIAKVNQIDRADNIKTYTADSNISLNTPMMHWQTLRNTATNDLTGLGQRLQPVGNRLMAAGADILTHKTGQVGEALGLSPAAAKAVDQTLANMISIGKDADRIFVDDLLPTARELGKLGGGAFYVGTALLKDTLGFVAAHPAEIKGVIDALIALYAVKKVGDGLAWVGQLPTQLDRATGSWTKWSGSVKTGLDTIGSPLDAVQGKLNKVTKGASPASLILDDTGTSASRASASLDKTRGSADGLTSSLKSGALSGALAGVTGGLVGYGIGASATSGGQVLSGGLVGALGAAAAGFAVGGPLGAAIGGFGAVAGTAIGYFTHISSAASTASKNAGTLGRALRGTLLTDKGTPGAASGDALTAYESSTPLAMKAFAAAGLTNADITGALTGHVDKAMQAVLGAGSGPGLLAAKYLNDISTQYGTAAQNDLTMAKLQGQALAPWQTTITASEAIASGTALAARQILLITGQLSPFAALLTPSSAAGATAALGLSGLSVPTASQFAAGKALGTNPLLNTISHLPSLSNLPKPVIGGQRGGARAAGGNTFAGVRYLVGEKGPEVVEMGGTGFVQTAARTARMMRGGGAPVTINVYQQPGEDGRALATRLSKTLSDVQAHQ